MRTLALPIAIHLLRCLIPVQMAHDLQWFDLTIFFFLMGFHYVAQAGLKLLGSIDLPDSTSWVLGLQACTTASSLTCEFLTL
jgi:hypothetical protein